MILTHLSLTNYRSFARLDMDMPRRILLLVGDNAQGKTSLLEAIYYLATFSSFHTPNDRQLINFLASNEELSVTRIIGDFQRNDKSHRIEIRLILENGMNGTTRLRKEFLFDNIKKSQHEIIGQFTAVIFLPQILRVIEGSPDERRRYLNLLLAQTVPGYSQTLSDYHQALTQRNALLKLLSERSSDPSQLQYWDELISQKGAAIIFARIAAIENLERLASRIHNQLTSAKEILRLIYQPAYDPLPNTENQPTLPIQVQAKRDNFSLDQIRKGFLDKLSKIRSEEIARGITTIGPHRDEIRFLCNGIDLGNYGSRGQSKTAMLSMKLAETLWSKEKTGQSPVLLLDEMLVELDSHRRNDLMDFIGQCDQTLITTTDLNIFGDEFNRQNTIWWVKEGRVSLIS